MKTIFNLILIFALAGFATMARAQDVPPPAQPGNQIAGDDIRNSYNNDLPWTAEPEGVTPGPPAPPIEVIGVVDARDVQDNGIMGTGDAQNYDDSGEQNIPTIIEFHNLGGFYGGNPPAAGRFHGGDGDHDGDHGDGGHGGGDGGSHGGTPPDRGGTGGRH